MNTVKINKNQTRMIAHRGVSGIECENTNAAFVAAGNRSYWGIETDVRRTADGQYIVIHDKTLQRISSGLSHANVTDTWFDAFSNVEFPDLDGSTIRRDLRVPLLEEYIHICKKYGKESILELKGFFSKDEIKEICEIIQKLNYLDHVVFIVFELSNCICLRELLPNQPLQWLTAQTIDESVIETLCRYHMDIDSEYTFLDSSIIERLHEHSIQVNCWTCNDPVEAKRLIDSGVDYITTNILE